MSLGPAFAGTVRPGSSLQEAVDQAAAGDTLLLTAGEYLGPVRIRQRITIRGPRDAVLRSTGVGTTIEVTADGVELAGFSIRGSGSRFEDTDAALHIRGNDALIEDLEIREALFGIAISGVSRVTVRRNEIIGSGLPDFGLRGDAIRLWEVRDSRIEENRVRRSRDLVVWYSPGNRLERNVVEDGRYGTHFMYSSRNVVQGNRYLRNLVGVFVMYCDEVEVDGNLMAAAVPGEGMGLGLKEAGNVHVRGNRFIRDPVAIFIDTSPIQRGHENVFSENAIDFCDSGVIFHSSEKQNRFEANEFRGSIDPVRVEGGGDAAGVDWKGNHFDDYVGYDLDGDGFGDVPYEPRSLSTQITSSRPSFRFFEGTPALGLLDLVSRVVPILQPKLLLSDPRPRMRPQLRWPNAD